MIVCRVENLNNLETNMRSKNNKTYTKDANIEFINCKADKTVNHCAYCKILLFSQVQHKNF